MRRARNAAVLLVIVAAAWGAIEIAKSVDRQRIAEQQAEFEMVEQRRRINRALQQAIPVQAPTRQPARPAPRPLPGQRDA
jgi:hypothetical protein